MEFDKGAAGCLGDGERVVDGNCVHEHTSNRQQAGSAGNVPHVAHIRRGWIARLASLFCRCGTPQHPRPAGLTRLHITWYESCHYCRSWEHLEAEGSTKNKGSVNGIWRNCWSGVSGLKRTHRGHIDIQSFMAVAEDGKGPRNCTTALPKARERTHSDFRIL